MSLSSFNSFLLSKFTKDLRLGPDVLSLVKRHQTLSIMYGNLALILMTIFYEIISAWLGIAFHHLPIMMTPFVLISFVSLKKGSNNVAALAVLMYAHLANAYISHYCYSSVAALAAVFIFPNFSFFMVSSTKIQIINAVICMIQVFGHIRNFLKVFAVTLMPEQTDEINHLVAISIPCLTFLCFLLLTQKAVENDFWKIAQMDQEKAEKINKEIMQAVESKEAFISSLSHEIRNPLNAMNGSISYLLEVVKDPSSLQVLRNARLSGETLLNLFNNLLDAAKLKSDKIELSYIETNLTEVLTKVLVINCENLKQKKLFVEVFISEAIPQIIRSDSARLIQIFMNLISNALKFTPEGGKIQIFAVWCNGDQTREALSEQINNLNPKNVNKISFQNNTNKEQVNTLFTDEFNLEEAALRIKNLGSIRTFKNKALDEINHRQGSILEQNLPWIIHKLDPKEFEPNTISSKKEKIDQNGFLKIQISDTGIGIAEKDIPKLFEMFTQVHRNVNSPHRGTGLGLWICKQICQKMKGDIKLYSKEGKGTTFVFYFPIHNEQLPRLHFSNDIDENYSFQKVSSLVVDDFAYNRDLFKLLLERDGVEVLLASDGEEAIKKYSMNYNRLDFILMDVHMPGVDGFTAAKKIRQLETKNNWKKVDIYFVSGEYYNEEEVISSFKTLNGTSQALGIYSLKKPVDIEVIKKIVEKYTKKLQ